MTRESKPRKNLTNSLADLAERIREATEVVVAAERTAADKALEAGRLLCQAKQECRHGEWLPFLQRAGVAERQAQRLMQLARSGLKSDTVSDLGGIKAALAYDAKQSPPNVGQLLLIGRAGWMDEDEYGPLAIIRPDAKLDAYFVSVLDLREDNGGKPFVEVCTKGASAVDQLMPDGSYIVPLWAVVDRMLDVPHAEREFTMIESYMLSDDVKELIVPLRDTARAVLNGWRGGEAAGSDRGSAQSTRLA
jgi:hypothetical protein